MPLSIKAKCFNGQSYDLSLDSATPSVADLQATISDASGITPDRQTILYKGQVLESAASLADYSLADGGVISVVRRIGKPSPSAPAPPKPAATSAPDDSAADAKPPDAAADDADGAPQPPSLEEMMRSLNMGVPPGAAGAPGATPPGMPDLSALMGGAAAGGAGAGAGGAGGAASMEQLFAQLPQMMNGILQSPMLQDYLNNSDKQEQSREAILNNPLLKGMLESDPEFAKVVNDPERWRASMEAAKHIFNSEGGEAGADGAAAGGETASREAGRFEFKGKGVTSAAARQSAADLAPAGIDIAKLSESYGHALGQSLINSGLGLDADLVIKGLRSAVDGKKFPMGLPEYERCMATLQNIASEFLTKANLEDADNFFEEIAADENTVMVEDGKVAYDKSEVEADASAAVVEEKATVLVIVSARLLDGRHFFTCPAADDSGDSVHPLTLPLETAPPALAKGIVGMRENESRLLYVHPTACEGMSDMFGDLLPPNALLIFDLQVVSANAPDEEEAGEEKGK